MTDLRISTPQLEGSLQGSKQLKFQVLLDEEEMRDLLSALQPLYICVVSEPTSMENAQINTQDFIAQYAQYISAIKEGRLIDEKTLRSAFSSIWTSTLDALYAMAVPSGKYLIKQIKPCIQLQAHHFFYSQLDKEFHPMVLSKESVTWGIQFSYPQLCQDPKTAIIQKVCYGDEFPNTQLFSTLTKWLREHTLPTPFVVDGKRTNSPIRLGKKCLPWISKHPQLVEKRIEILGDFSKF